MGCESCNGTGRQIYRMIGDALPVDMGDGTTMQYMGGSGTRACKCVRDLPAIDGHATWWESETIYREVVGVPIGDECVEITADCEIPRGDDGRRYHRTAENAYYPPLIKLDMERSATLHSDTAREIAAALIAAADACDKADELAVQTRAEDGYQGARP